MRIRAYMAAGWPLSNALLDNGAELLP